MLTSKVSRGVAILLLLGALFGLMVWYGSIRPAPQGGSFPGAEMLVKDYAAHVGERVTVIGMVIRADPLVIRIESDGQMLRLRVTEVSTSATIGQEIRIFGIAKEQRTIRAIHAFTVPGRGLGYAYSVSFLAGLWILLRIGRQWRFDRATGGFKPRVSDRGVDEGSIEEAGEARHA